MTTTPFTPTATQAFTWQPTLDGATYTGVVTWNLTGQRWYLNIYTLQNTRVLTVPVVGSPDGRDINLVAGYFKTSTLVFRQSSQSFEVLP